MTPAEVSPESAPPRRRRPVNIYVVMLGIALLALFIGWLMLLLEWSRYGFQMKARASLNSPAASTALIGPDVCSPRRIA